MGSTYAQKGSSGGSVYASKGSTGGSVYAGKGGGSASAKKSRGGVFGGLERGAHWVASKAGLAAHDVKAIPGGIYDLGKTETQVFSDDFHGRNKAVNRREWHDLVHGHLIRMVHEADKGDATAAKAHTEQIVGALGASVNTVRKHPLRDPFATALTVLPFVHGVGSAAGRAAEISKAGSVGEAARAAVRTPPVRPRLLRQGDATLPLHPSASPLVRAGQGAYDRVLQRGLDRNPEGRVAAHAARRIGGSIAETGRYQQRLREVPAAVIEQHSKIVAKRSGVPRQLNEAALRLTSEQSTAEEAQAYHKAQAAKGVGVKDNTKLAKVYGEVGRRKMVKVEGGKVVINADLHPHLAAADAKIAAGQAQVDQILAEHGIMEPAALRSRIDAPARVRAGAAYETPTPAKAGVPSQSLLKARSRVARLQVLHDRATEQAAQGRFTPDQQRLIDASDRLPPGPDETVKVPRTVEEARTHLEKLEARYHAFIDNFVSSKLTKEELRYQRDVVNPARGKFRKQQSGRTATGRASGASGHKVQRLPKNVAEENRAQAEAEMYRIAEKNAHLPAAQAFLQLSELRNQLRSAINQHEEESLGPAATDYRGGHTAPEPDENASLDNLAGIYPEDIYGPDAARLYGHGGNHTHLDKQTAKIIQSFRGKPDAELTVYRAVPKATKTINPGDWVTPNRGYAAEHAAGEEGMHIIERRVRAGDVYTDANSIHEFGWHPKAQAPIDFGTRLKTVRGSRPTALEARMPSGKVVTSKGAILSPKGAGRAERLGAALSVSKDELARLEGAAANRVKPTGIVGGAQARPGRGFVSYKTVEPKAPRSQMAGGQGPVISATKPFIGKQAFTGHGLELGKVPENTSGLVARHMRSAYRYLNTHEFRQTLLRTSSDIRRSSRDILIRDPKQIPEQIPADIEQALGRKTLTTDELAGHEAAYQDFTHRMIPGLRDKFASDKGQAIGAKAPAGYRWVDRNSLGDLARAPAGQRGRIARAADNVNSAVTAATVYFKIGHVGTRVLTNASTNIIQGSARPVEIAKSVRLWKDLGHEDRLRALAAAGQHGFAAMPHEGTSVASKVAGKGANWWAKHADATFRFNSIAYEARKAGFDTAAKFRGMLAKMENPHGLDAAQTAKIDWVAKRANREGIAYDRLSASERQYLTRAVWFYPWLRGTAGFAYNTFAEHPYKTAALGQLGTLGRTRQEQGLGDLPDYEGGLIKIGGPANRPRVADFSTFSPFATPADITDALARPGELSGFLNPALTAGTNLVFGLNPQGGRSKSPIKDALASLPSPTPEAQILTAYLQRHKDQSKRMFPKSPALAGTRDPLLRALLGPGMPRRLNPAAAHSAAARQRAGR